jgi:DNA-binding response OmpR family regulator
MNKKRLLVVDDDPAIGEIIGTVAEELGYEVVVTSLPAQFRDLYASFDPSAIIVDIVMPEIDGIELLHYLASENCKALIILTTGYSGSYLKYASELGKSSGLESIATLTKPFRLTELRAALG